MGGLEGKGGFFDIVFLNLIHDTIRTSFDEASLAGILMKRNL